MSSILTVTQLNRYASFVLKEDDKLRGAFIRGEISNFTNHVKTGHLFFTLKDSECSVKAVMFSSNAMRLSFVPQTGMSVILQADVRIFERDGAYQLYVNDMQPDGIGALYANIERVKEKLLNEGLFDEELKKPLSLYPQKIGIVTSTNGDAIRDILQKLEERYPIVEAVVFPCLVQGENALNSMIEALDKADGYGLDVIIIGRGGGSFEDLMVFNEESLARKISAVNTPVISAVGHEADVTLVDFVADVRASTPTAAAVLAVPEIGGMYNAIDVLEQRLKRVFANFVYEKRNAISAREKQLEYLVAVKQKAYEEKEKLTVEIKKLEAEKEILAKEEYAYVYKDGELIKSAKSVKSGDILTVRFADGEVKAEVRE